MEVKSLILDFVDGTLSSEDEEKLFFHLSVDEELRDGLRNLMIVEKAVTDSSASFAPAAHVTSELFEKLDFAIPTTMGSESVRKLPWWKRISAMTLLFGFFRNYRQALLGALASAAICAILWYILTPGTENAGEQLSKERVSSSVPEGMAPEAGSGEARARGDGAIPKISSFEVTEQDNARSANELVPQSASAVPTKREFPDKRTSASMNPSNKGAGALYAAEDQPDTKAKKMTRGPDVPRLETVQPQSNWQHFRSVAITRENWPQRAQPDVASSGLSASAGDPSFWIETRGTAQWTLPEATIDPDELSSLNNTTIAAFYRLNDNFSVGLDFRQETFFQQFTGVNSFGRRVTWEQQPNFTTFGAALRYEHSQTTAFRPFAQATAGANRGGFAGRIMIGGRYGAYESLAFIFGVELSSLLYQSQSELFSANKIGVHYGVAIGL